MSEVSGDLVRERLMKVSEVAEMFGVTPATVREWLKAGILKGNKINKHWRVTESAARELAHQTYGDKT